MPGKDLIMKDAVIAAYGAYDPKRYDRPRVGVMTENGIHDYGEETGTYTGGDGEAGNLIVFEPRERLVYCYDQREYRSGEYKYRYKVWDGTRFISCDREGNSGDFSDDVVVYKAAGIPCYPLGD